MYLARTVLGTAAAAITLLGAVGCGTDRGQANALTACHVFASANGGGLTTTALTAKLSKAVDYAGKASRQNAQWDILQSSIAQFVAASTQTPVPAGTVTVLRTARKVIDSSCELAARGY